MLISYPGNFLALRGPPGSGKTALINLHGLLDVPDKGKLLLESYGTVTLSPGQHMGARQQHRHLSFKCHRR